MQVDSLLATGELALVLVAVVLLVDALDVEGLVAVEPADDVVEHVAVLLLGLGLELLVAGVVQEAEEVFLGRLGDELLAVLLRVDLVAEAVLGRQRDGERLQRGLVLVVG